MTQVGRRLAEDKLVGNTVIVGDAKLVESPDQGANCITH
jgi:hypothetical protein